MIAGSGDNAAAARGRGDGRLRVSRDDREQAVELLKTAFVDERLTREELDARVGQALASRTRADLTAVTADIPGGLNVSQPPREPVQVHGRLAGPAHGQPPARYVARHAAKAGTAKAGTAKAGTAKAGTAKAGTAKARLVKTGIAVGVALKVLMALSFVTSIPLLFLLIAVCCVTAVIVAVAWIQVSRN